MENCPLCDSKNFEVMEDQSFLCKTCGFGIKGKPDFANYFDYLNNYLLVITKVTKTFFPDLSQQELTNKIMRVLHEVEKHPTRPDGYCEFCEKVIK